MKKQTPATRVAFFGIATAMALMLSYLDSLIPLSAVFPGVRLGLANTVTVVLLYRFGGKSAALCSFLRVILAWLLFSGNAAHLLYSASGAAVSFLLMLLLRRLDVFGLTGVSVAGGVAHNLSQIACAVLLTRTPAVASVLPVLLLTGTISGAGIGVVAGVLCRKTDAFSGDDACLEGKKRKKRKKGKK